MTSQMVSWRLTVILMLGRQALSNLRQDGRGPFDVLMKQGNDCGDENARINFVLHSKTTSTSMTLYGRIKLDNITFNDDLKMKSVMQLYRKNGWKDYMVFEFGDKGICTLADKTFDRVSIERLTSSMIDQNNQTFPFCDKPPGEYSFPAIELYYGGNKMFSEFTYGSYRSLSKFYYKDYGHEVGCYTAYYDVIPKKKAESRG